MAPLELAALGVAEARERIGRGTLSPVALVEACLERIAALDATVQAWVHVDAKGALAAARLAEHAAVRGPLHGIPVAVKDIFDVAGLPTTAGAPPFAHRRPDEDAASVALLRAAGAIVLGKTHTTQFAYRDPAPTRNPWNLAHTPGGSSSGSAAAVAARMVPLALGSQTVPARLVAGPRRRLHPRGRRCGGRVRGADAEERRRRARRSAALGAGTRASASRLA